MTFQKMFRVNADRLWDTINQSAAIGPGRRPDGLSRLALSDADKEMRNLFVRWCQDANCSLGIDQIGNIFARRQGQDTSLPPVVIGSHLDTQIAGGRFDGILGVLSGLEVIRSLNDYELSTRRSIEVVSWTNEEGARFQPPMMGSSAFAGTRDLQWLLDQTDAQGYSVRSELRRIGYAGRTKVGARPLDSYFEIHIEQGPKLYELGLPLGVVVGSHCVKGLNIAVHGETAHAGPTPMDRRKNALTGAAMIAVSVNEIGWKYHPSEGKSTVSRLSCWPNLLGILPDYAELTVDVRHKETSIAQSMMDELIATFRHTENHANVSIEILNEWGYGDEKFDPSCIELVKQSARRLDIPVHDMFSQAGHDAYQISRIAPTCLIFTPCKDGITHNELEHIEPEYTIPGVNVLLNTVLARANQ